MLGESVQEIAVRSKEVGVNREKVYDWETATKIISSLVEQEYVVMVSLEEGLIIIDYTETESLLSDRNGVFFMNEYDHEEMLRKEQEELEEEYERENGENN